MSKEKKVYIAEDETNIRLGVKAFLESAGYNVHDFENGDLLMDAFHECPADLVILDIMMPGTNGFAICKELREKSRIPIVMMTARSSDLDYATGLDLGCDDYITKPFKIADLVERVDKVFERVESQMEGYNDTSVHR